MGLGKDLALLLQALFGPEYLTASVAVGLCNLP